MGMHRIESGRLNCRPNQWIPLACALLFAGGCSWDQGLVDNQFQASEVDSAGVTVVQVASVPAGGEEIVIAADPTFTVGTSAGDALGRLRGAMITPSDEVRMVDQIEAALLVYDLNGNRIRKVGRSGRGPGEFTRPALAIHCDASKTAVVDWATNDLSIMDSRGEYVTRYDLGPRSGTAFAACDAGILTRYVIESTEDGSRERRFEFRLFDPADPQGYPLLALPLAGQMTFQALLRDPNQPVRFNQPFDYLPSAAVSDSTLFIYDGESPVLRQFTFDGELIAIYRMPFQLLETSDERIQQWVRSPEQYGNRPDEDLDLIEKVYLDGLRPETIPPFLRIVSSADGRVWMELTEPYRQGSANWLVFDPSTRLLVPARLQSSGNLEFASERFAVVSRTNEFNQDIVDVFSVTQSDIK